MGLSNLKLDKQAFEEIKLVVFRFPGTTDDIRFGINAHKVKEVVEVDNFEKLPTIYRPYVGILNLRGVPVPILDMNSILNGVDDESILDNDNYRIIVCETLGKTVGILASQKIKMYEFDDREISHASFATGKSINQEYVSGIVEQDGTYIFMLNIETALEELTPEEYDPAHQKKLLFKGKKALVVEDSMLFMKKVSRLLESLGFEVFTALNGQEGLDQLESLEHVDLLFSDIEMPYMNGIEMIRKVKRNIEYAKIPIIFHSSISNPELIKQIEEEGLGEYITKFDESLIIEKISSVID